MEKVIVYGLGTSWSTYEDYIRSHFEIVGYSDAKIEETANDKIAPKYIADHLHEMGFDSPSASSSSNTVFNV